VKVFAERSVCEVDKTRLSARAELRGPDNFPVTDVSVSAPQVALAVADSGAPRVQVQTVSVEVTFTPSRGGQHLMQVFFEPMLDGRSVLVDVGEPRVDPPSVRVRVPSWAECVDQPWPVSADAVACERSTKRVEVYVSDGGVSSFDGEQLVVAGSVLWSVEAATSELERHVFVDGGLVLTDVFAGFSTRTVRSMHDERSALRARNSGALVLARVESSLVEFGWPSNSVNELLFIDGERLFSEVPCGSERCFGFHGVEPEMLWTVENLGAGVGGVRRPIPVDHRGQDLILQRKVELPQAPERGFERVPLWLPVEGTGLSALVNADRPSLGLTVWNRSHVIRVGKQFVVLKDPSNGDDLRVTPR
jgi:hypothetical protein